MISSITKQESYNRGTVDIGPMKEETKQMLNKFYYEFNLQLAQYLKDPSYLQWNHG